MKTTNPRAKQQDAKKRISRAKEIAKRRSKAPAVSHDVVLGLHPRFSDWLCDRSVELGFVCTNQAVMAAALIFARASQQEQENAGAMALEVLTGERTWAEVHASLSRIGATGEGRR